MKTRLLTFVVVAGCGTGVYSDPSDPRSILTVDGSMTVDEACVQPTGPTRAYATKSEFDSLIVGKWYHCTGPLAGYINAAGIELSADGNYYELGVDGTRESNFGSQGTWDSVESAAGVELIWYGFDVGGAFAASPVFEDVPRRFELDNGRSIGVSTYVEVQ